MSRIGKKPIEIPKKVEVKINGQKVVIKGPKGELVREVRPEVELSIKEDKLLVTPKIKTKKTGAYWGLTRALLFNMIEGVTKGFEKKLEIQGVGYKVVLEGETLVLNVGFSHSVKVDKVEGVTFLIEKNIITLSGIDKELVGQVAAKIRRVRPPEPYKGKGIRYVGEVVRRKVGKKAATAGV